MTTVLICDDDPIVCEALGAYLERERDLQVVAMVGTAEEALAQIEAARPDVVLMDRALPGMDGIEATRLARSMRRSEERRVGWEPRSTDESPRSRQRDRR